MRDPDKKLDSPTPTAAVPLARTLLTAVSRRQVLKASLFGMGGLSLAAAAGGLVSLASLAAAQSGLGRWRQLFPNSAPSPRGGAVMAYDGGRRVPVLFSGTWGWEADTWTWNGLTWNRQSPLLSPPARSGASFAYHPPTDTLVLFGGVSAKGWLGDTWLWNGTTWTAVLGDGPPARGSASMSFDPASGGLILFGGYGSGTFHDTWMWNGRSWARLSPRSSPPGRYGTSLAYDSVIKKLIIFGGKSSPMGVPEPEATWAWDGTNWSQMSLNPSPPWRFYASMAVRPEGGPILLFGGVALASGSPSLGDTWTLGSTWSAVTQTPAPPPRAFASLVPHPSGNALLLFGGASGGHPLGDTWVWEFS